ncbi:MAG: hypothetical protein S4CHLAM37_10600 [Chlamydiia bacterium]|nr:hypothetical protein [Chlamydiia bacterium]
MPAIPQAPDFKAAWTAHNNELKPLPFTSTMERIIYVAKEIIVYIPRAVASMITRWMIYPAASPFISNARTQTIANKHFDKFWKTTQAPNAFTYDNSWFPATASLTNKIREAYSPQEITLESPDGETLHGHYIKHKDADTPGAKVILAFGGNGEPYCLGSVTNWMQEMLCDHDTPHSFLMIDPRGVFKSTGKPTQTGLVLDADTLHQYAENLGYDKDNIILYGHSMGGAMATHLKALHTDSNAPLILSRTFSSLSKESEHIASQLPFNPARLIKYIIRNLGWKFNNVEQLQKIKSPVHIFNHVHDQVIPREAALATAMDLPENTKDHIHTYDVTGGFGHMEKFSQLTICGMPSVTNAAAHLRDHVFTNVAATQASA